MTNNLPNNTKENYSVQFLIEEYKNITATHDKIRDNIARIFNYFLILNVFPFTVFNLFDAPLSLHLLFLAVGLADFFYVVINA